MDDELLAAVAELRAWAAADGRPMDHMSDAEVLEGAMHAMTMMPGSTAQVVKEHGLTRLAPILARLVGSPRDAKHSLLVFCANRAHPTAARIAFAAHHQVWRVQLADDVNAGFILEAADDACALAVKVRARGRLRQLAELHLDIAAEYCGDRRACNTAPHHPPLRSSATRAGGDDVRPIAYATAQTRPMFATMLITLL